MENDQKIKKELRLFFYCIMKEKKKGYAFLEKEKFK